MNGLINYTILHFSFEEELQRQHGYPSCEAHKKKHDADEDIAKKLSGALILWLTSHIKQEDKDYIPYCNKPLKQRFLKKWWGNFLSKNDRFNSQRCFD